jgi:hypothetical protein
MVQLKSSKGKLRHGAFLANGATEILKRKVAPRSLFGSWNKIAPFYLVLE